MKYALTIILIIEILSSCFSTPEESNTRELVPNPEKYEHDGYLTLPDSLKPKFLPDTSIGQLNLINSKHVDTYLGSDIMERLVDYGLPQATIFTKDKKQKLIIYFHPGSVSKEFSEFKIEYNNDHATDKIIIVKEDEFRTESKIALGISVGDLKSIKGEPNSVTKQGEKMNYHYQIEDFKDSNFLKKYNMPIYYADYLFSNGYLAEFKFGFEYP